MKKLLLFGTCLFAFTLFLSAQEKNMKQEIKKENANVPDEFTKKVVELPLTPEGSRAVGDDCTSPIVVSVPANLPYANTNTTCGRGNTYSTSCLGYYDGGEDIMYQLNVTATTTVTITMDPLGTTYTGIYLSATCGNSATCIATVTGSTATPRVISNQVLTAGNSYYIMIDTWPSPNCIPSFNLSIVAIVPCDPVTTFPLAQSFDGALFPPTCWTTAKTAGTSSPGTWDRQTTGTNPTCTPHSGAGMTRYDCWDYSSGTKGILVSPAMNLPNNNFSVKFWMFRDGTNYLTTPDLVNVYYNTAGNLSGATLLGTVNRSINLSPVVATQGWYQYNFGLPSGSMGNNRFIIFEGVSAYGENIFLDDIEIAMPSALQGYVYDYDGNPVVGATVSLVGGISTTSGAGGYYLLTPLSAGSQQFQCAKTGYNPVTATINIPYSSTANHNFTLTQPKMDVSPLSISAILLPGETYSTPITIKNDGNGPLGWTATPVNSFIDPIPVPPEPTGYCPNSSTICDEFISQVIFGTINKTSACEMYADFTSESTSVTPGNSYTISVKVGPPVYASDYVRVWVDWNRNGLFDEAPVTLTGSLPNVTGTIAVPGNASFGATRMRIYLTYSTLPDACTPPSNGYGEVEDYNVVVRKSWLSANPSSGTVPPFGGSGSTSADIDATGLTAGATYNADIVFTSDPDVGTKTAHVTLVVGDPGLAGPIDLHVDAINTSQGKVRLMWEYNARAVWDHFIVERNGVIIGSTKKMEYIDTITPGDYCYKVYAVYDNGHISPPSNQVCFSFPMGPKIPLAPWALLIGAGLILGWTVYLVRRRA